MRNQRGFTLIEITLSLAILAAVLASSFALSSRAFRQGRDARSRVVATNLAQEQIEGLRNFRDNNDWAGFQALVPNCPTPPVSSCIFHMDNSLASPGMPKPWKPQGGSVNDPRLGDSQISIAGSYAPANQFNYSVTIQWPSSSGVPFTTVIYSKLVDIGGAKPN